MGYTIPQNWNDEAMEYVNRLTDKINVGGMARTIV